MDGRPNLPRRRDGGEGPASSWPRSLISLRNQVSANASSTTGTADSNTVLSADTNEETTGSRTAGGSAAITCGEPVSCDGLTPCSAAGGSRWASSEASRLASIVPKSAVPKVPPSDRKNVAEDVATPMSVGRRSSAWPAR